MGVHVFFYVDNYLIKDKKLEAIQAPVPGTIRSLATLGLKIKYPESQLFLQKLLEYMAVLLELKSSTPGLYFGYCRIDGKYFQEPAGISKDHAVDIGSESTHGIYN